ncbi:autoimmune regulator-like isoform X1 [Brachyistius frenatus]|uniref:autoimmune regulator-like isoform X1 n=1 Tax=Brachyistius frenatus TaxID=100188 RepID=UPI0037E7E4FF
MDPLDFFNPDELLRFLHCKKTELSCMENPHTFLSQLRDHNLVPEDRYKKVSRMKSKENIKRALYEILDWLEKEKSQHITVFWTCVFKETILNKYPKLRELRNSLMDGSYHCDAQLPPRVELEERNKKELSADEQQTMTKSGKKKRKQKHMSMCDDDDDEEEEEEEEEQPGASAQVSLSPRKKAKKICFSSPLKKGEKTDFWTWPIYKYQLPVTCGDQEAFLKRDRLAKGEKCIVVKNQWFTPSEFERFAGKQGNRNWKLSIRCRDIPLGKLIQKGHLEAANYRHGSKKVKKSLFPSEDLTTESEGEDDEGEESNQEDQVSSSEKASATDEEEQTEEQTEQQLGVGPDKNKMVFEVTSGAVAGKLYKKRFASGTCGKSIRTETSWMSPVDFVNGASGQTGVSWKKDILWQGQPLSVLIEAKVLMIHSLLCPCSLCSKKPTDLDDQKNDDECCICKSEEDGEVVECDHCPRSFHPTCHLPPVEDNILGDDRPWMCTFCIFRTCQEYRYADKLEREAAMSRQISQHMLECQYLLMLLCTADEEQIFTNDPSLHVENYSTFIITPMWLGKVAEELSKKQYLTVGKFVSDVQLIFTNCEKYNQNNAEFLAMGDRLKKLFDGEFEKAFNIHEETAG